MSRRLLFALLLLAPAAAFASPEGAEGAANSGAALADLGLRALNFALLVAGLVFVARKFKLLPGLAGSVEAVRKSLEEAETAEKEASLRLAAAEAKMTELEAEVDRMLVTARAEAEQEKQAILADAGREVEKIRREAQLAMEQELKKVQDSLKAEMAASVVRIADELLRRSVQPDDQKRFVRDYLDQLEGMSR
jgi:F-type H+-transporting ATPase subunit b